MRSLESLRAWTQRVLPRSSRCAQEAAWVLLRALFVQFTTNLSQLARHAGRATPARGTRQFFARWLHRAAWDPAQIYAALPSLWPAFWSGSAPCPLLLDLTHLGGGGRGWSVLQVSVPWQRRALPVYRQVFSRTAPELGQTEAVLAACDWLAAHLPGGPGRYVLIMDRGFPSKALVNALQARDWRFVLRIDAGWRMTHAAHRGLLAAAVAVGQVTADPQLFLGAQFGWRDRGPQVQRHSCRANLVWYYGAGHQEPWFLVTSEADAAVVVALYRQRMQIEAEFRDLKGPFGLDALMDWQDRGAVARFLALLAVYEWRLAALWVVYALAQEAPRFVVRGALSWIRLTREWIAHRLYQDGCLALDCL